MNTSLSAFFKQNPKFVLAFSGGTDSAFLLWAALQAGCDCQPVFIKSDLQPAFEEVDARNFCQLLPIDLVTLAQDIWANHDICQNSPLRCYHCKKALFQNLKNWAEQHGYPLVIEGTNASDDITDRPGYKALQELGIPSPLRAAGLTKKAIRQASREAGLFTWNKPAYACLATRVTPGQEITPAKLQLITTGENILTNMGFHDFRIRLNPWGAKLEITATDWPKLLEKREVILEQLTPLFKEVCVNLKVRHGD